MPYNAYKFHKLSWIHYIILQSKFAKMDTIISVFISEVTNRAIFFLIDRYLKPAPYKKDIIIQRLQWMLLRLQVMVEEAGGRCVTNLAMLQQLNNREKSDVQRLLHARQLHTTCP